MPLQTLLQSNVIHLVAFMQIACWKMRISRHKAFDFTLNHAMAFQLSHETGQCKLTPPDTFKVSCRKAYR